MLVIVLAEAGEHGVWAFVRERVSAYRKAGRGRVGIAGRGQLAVSILRHRLKERVQSRDELDIPRRVLDGHGSTECQARVQLRQPVGLGTLAASASKTCRESANATTPTSASSARSLSGRRRLVQQAAASTARRIAIESVGDDTRTVSYKAVYAVSLFKTRCLHRSLPGLILALAVRRMMRHKRAT